MSTLAGVASAVAQARRRVNNSQAARTGRAWQPWQAPTAPPPGTYDPTLDATLGQAGRGLGDFQQDTERNSARSSNDYIRGRADVQRDAGWGREDLTRSRDRGLFDVGQARTYEGQDYGRSIQGLDRSYGRLADSQAEQINAAGLSGGGASLQAARKRAENLAWDRQPIDTGHGRAVAGFDTATGRLNEDYGTQTGRLNDTEQRQLGALDLGQQRYSEDSGTALSRAAREYDAFSQDTGAARFYQAAGTGWTPPPRPAGEGHRGNVNYRRLPDGRAMLPDGRIVSAAGLRRMIGGAGA